MKLNLEFKRILTDQNFDRSPLIENLHNCQTKADLFLYKKNLKSEKLSYVNDTIDEDELMHEKTTCKQEEQAEIPKEEESKFSKMFYVIVIVVIVLIAVCLLYFKFWFRITKTEETKVVLASSEPGISNVQFNENVKVIEVSDFRATDVTAKPEGESSPNNDTPKTTSADKAEVAKVADKNTSKMAGDLPVLLADNSDFVGDEKTLLLSSHSNKSNKQSNLRIFNVKAHRIAAKKSKRTLLESEQTSRISDSKRAIMIKHNYRIV